jgi:DNA repair exonuclease SbcCD nuclease subunit
LKLLIFSDLHLHNWTYGRRRLDGQHSFLDHIASIAWKPISEIGAVICCGDFFHRRGAIDPLVATVASKFCSSLREKDIPLFLLPGNHDATGRESVSSLTHLQYVGACVPTTPQTLYVDTHLGRKEDDIKLGFIPFQSKEENFRRGVDHVMKDHPDVLFIHQGIKGCDMGSGYLLDEWLTPDMLPDVMTFAGHYHVQREVTPKLVIVGPPMQHTWSDKNTDTGFIIYDTTTKTYERFPTNVALCPRFKEIEYGEIKMNLVAGLENIREFLAWNIVRVLNCPMDVDPDLQKTLVSLGANHVEFQIEKESKVYEALVDRGVNIDQAIKQLTSNMTVRERLVGADLMQGTYEV